MSTSSPQKFYDFASGRHIGHPRPSIFRIRNAGLHEARSELHQAASDGNIDAVLKLIVAVAPAALSPKASRKMFPPA